jgi:hypothetical protein
MTHSTRLRINNDGSITLVHSGGLDVKIEPNGDGSKDIVITRKHAPKEDLDVVKALMDEEVKEIRSQFI